MRTHVYPTRNRGQMLPRAQHLTISQHSLSYTAPVVWNQIPESVQLSATVDIFKHRLAKYLISQYAAL